MIRMRRLLRDTCGATVVETALVLPVLLVLTFGLLEFGLAIWRYNVAEKATADAARYLATHGPIVAPATVPECFVNDDEIRGTPCSEVPGASAWSAVCGAGVACDAGVIDAAVTRMREIAPFVAPENVEIELSGSNLGYVGRGRPVPIITVRLVDLTYDFIALDGLLGLDGIVMPGFDASSVGEDLGEGVWS